MKLANRKQIILMRLRFTAPGEKGWLFTFQTATTLLHHCSYNFQHASLGWQWHQFDTESRQRLRHAGNYYRAILVAPLHFLAFQHVQKYWQETLNRVICVHPYLHPFCLRLFNRVQLNHSEAVRGMFTTWLKALNSKRGSTVPYLHTCMELILCIYRLVVNKTDLSQPRISYTLENSPVECCRILPDSLSDVQILPKQATVCALHTI